MKNDNYLHDNISNSTWLIKIRKIVNIILHAELGAINNLVKTMIEILWGLCVCRGQGGQVCTKTVTTCVAAGKKKKKKYLYKLLMK